MLVLIVIVYNKIIKYLNLGIYMFNKKIVDTICKSLYEGSTSDAITLFNKHPELINAKSSIYDNKTILMCVLGALENSSNQSEQQDLFKLIGIIIKNTDLDLKVTDDYGNTIFHLAFKYARAADPELSKAFFNIGEKFLKLIKDEDSLKKLVNKKNKSSIKKSQKIFLQYIFPDLQEENLLVPEMENLIHVQKRVTSILMRIFHFSNLLEETLTDPISGKIIITPFLLPKKSVTLSWDTWLRIIEQPTSIPSATIKKYVGSTKFTRTDLIHDATIESFLGMYHAHRLDEETLISRLEDYITINIKNTKKSTSKSSLNSLTKNIMELTENFRKYLDYIDKLTPHKLGLQHDKHRH